MREKAYSVKKKKKKTEGERQEKLVVKCMREREKKWKDDKEMAQHLRLEAILTVPPSLPLTLIITVF